MNSTFRLATWADALYAADLKWWDECIGDVQRLFRGELWSHENAASKKHGLFKLPGRPGVGLGRDAIHFGGNSGYQVINLAYLFGAAKIILLGYDMQMTGGQSHWHGDHPWALRKKPPVQNWISRFKALAHDLETEGVEVINATRETALTCFPRRSIEVIE